MRRLLGFRRMPLEPARAQLDGAAACFGAAPREHTVLPSLDVSPYRRAITTMRSAPGVNGAPSREPWTPVTRIPERQSIPVNSSFE